MERRTVRVLFDDGESFFTEINGSIGEIMAYYLGSQFEKPDETTHICVNVEFLDGPLQRGEWFPASYGNWFRAVRHSRIRPCTEIARDDLFTTIELCREECDRLNSVLGDEE